ncbi:MAG TPA: DUF2269 family protein [Acidimicrobiales bacterium]|nr:DUF2269 family protein [Acidimicrobiales bacterium]
MPTADVIAALSPTSTGYRLLLLGHLLSVIIGFGSTFVYPVLGAQASKHKGVGGAAISEAADKAGKFVTEPFVIASGLFGVVLVVVGPFNFDALWIQAAVTLYVAAMVFSFAVHLPNLKRLNALAQEMAAGPPPGASAAGPPPQVAEMERRGKAVARNGGILHLLFAALLLLMIFKPA